MSAVVPEKVTQWFDVRLPQTAVIADREADDAVARALCRRRIKEKTTTKTTKKRKKRTAFR